MQSRRLTLALVSDRRRRWSPSAAPLRCLTSGRHTTATVVHSHAAGQQTYYNFKTLRQFPDGPPVPQALAASPSSDNTDGKHEQQDTQAAPRLYLSHRNGTADGLPLHNTTFVDPARPDPYQHVRIFRRDMAEGGYSSHTSGRAVPLSVDVSLKRFQDAFCDYEGKRCKLCNESFLQWYSHQSSVPHTARECLALELVRAHCGTPEDIVKMWWHRLDSSPSFRRIPSLSHANSYTRKRRLQFLLKYLKDRDVVREAFNVRQQASSAGRTWEFERLEFLGDNVIKYLFNNRIRCLFPVSEGGTRGKIGLFQFLIDGNDGLARAHDFLELQQLTLSDRVVSKFKSDVVETLFGELQVFLWSSEIDLGTERVPHPFTKGSLVLRELVYHVMEELAHVMIMYHIEYVLGSVQRVAREQQLQFVQTEPQASARGVKGGLHSRDGGIAGGPSGSMRTHTQAPVGLTVSARRSPYRGSAASGVSVPPPTAAGNPFDGSASRSHVAAAAVEDTSGASVYWETKNYDKFALVTPLGGLLPRPFHAHELAPVPNYLPHLQPDFDLTERLPENVAHDVQADMDANSDAQGVDADEGSTTNLSQGSSGTDAFALPLSSVRRAPPLPASVKGKGRPTPLSVAELKDSGLVTELL